MQISPATERDKDEWRKLRCALWPDSAGDDLNAMLEDNARFTVLVARDDAGAIVGFAEASLRHDYVNGCSTSPVAFLEGLYVAPTHRHLGFARALVDAVEHWGREKGCAEFASDALLDNMASHKMHKALGFQETERVIYFRKPL